MTVRRRGLARLFRLAVLLAMASRTERNQIFTLIATELATTSKMMDLQFGRRTANLTAPAIAL
jgi:hypothetical protein